MIFRNSASAKNLNDRVLRGREYYRERLVHYLKLAMTDGYLVGQVPQRDPQAELAQLAPQIPQLQQEALDMSHPAPYRAQVQEKLRRFSELLQTQQEQLKPPPPAPQMFG